MSSRKPSILICIFVSRSTSSLDIGQGTELLFYTPPAKRSAPANPNHFEFVQIDAFDRPEARDLDDASLKRSYQVIAKNLLLDGKKDLRFVRRSKRIPWTDGSSLEAFLFRMTEGYERGRAYEKERLRAKMDDRKLRYPEEVTEQAYETDLAIYRLVCARIGLEHHAFRPISYITSHPTPIEFINTSFHLVVLPPLLDLSLHVFSKLSFGLPSSDVSDLALNVLFELVTNKAGRQVFTFWAPGVPMPTKETKSLPEHVTKYRLHAFWVDELQIVVAHHLRICNPSLCTIVSSALLRILTPLRPLISDPSISIDQLESRALSEIANESQRQSFILTVLDKLAVGKILHRPTPPPTRRSLPSPPKREVLNVITLGNSTTTYSVLKELIHHLLTSPDHPYSTFAPGCRTMSRGDELDWLDRPKELKVTILETRPGLEGVLLGQRLAKAIEVSRGMAKELRGLTKASRMDEKGEAVLPESLRQRLKGEKEGEQSEVEKAWKTLQGSLKNVDTIVEPPGASKVTITIIPDAALFSSLHSCPADSVVVLIGAERVRSDSRVLAALGATALAWLGSEYKARVYVVASTECIEPSSPGTTAPLGRLSEVIEAWPSSASLDPFKDRVSNEDTTGVLAGLQRWDEVGVDMIDAWITENGVLSKDGVRALAKERDEAEKTLFGAVGE